MRERGYVRGSRPGNAACPWSLINAACLAGKFLCLVASTCNCHADSWPAILLYPALSLPLFAHRLQGSPVENFLCMAASWKLILPHSAHCALLSQIQQVVLICNSKSCVNLQFQERPEKKRLLVTAHMRNVLCRLCCANKANWFHQLTTVAYSSGLIEYKTDERMSRRTDSELSFGRTAYLVLEAIKDSNLDILSCKLQTYANNFSLWSN